MIDFLLIKNSDCMFEEYRCVCCGRFEVDPCLPIGIGLMCVSGAVAGPIIASNTHYWNVLNTICCAIASPAMAGLMITACDECICTLCCCEFCPCIRRTGSPVVEQLSNTLLFAPQQNRLYGSGYGTFPEHLEESRGAGLEMSPHTSSQRAIEEQKGPVAPSRRFLVPAPVVQQSFENSGYGTSSASEYKSIGHLIWS